MGGKVRAAGKALISGRLLPLATVYEALTRAAPTGTIEPSAVQQALGLRSRYLAQRVLAALGGADGAFESAEQFAAAAQKVMAAEPRDKLEFLFRLHDADGDGWIGRDEVERLLHMVVAENELQLPESELEGLVQAVMEEGDQDSDGRIGVGEFIRMMVAHPAMEQQLTHYGVSLLMPGKRARQMLLVPGASWRGWVRNEFIVALWIGLFVAANALLFVEALLRYREAGANLAIQLARGAGACLNLNAALIVVPMLRHTLTWVRKSRFARYAPVDDAAALHALIGETIVLLSLLHTVAHGVNVWQSDADAWSAPYLTGGALFLVLAVLWLFSRPFVRSSGRFELFHATHLGYIGMVALLFVHGPRFWLWGSVPWLWFVLERTLRRRATTRVVAATTLASGVTRIELERPAQFRYAAGDYLFLRVPAIARHEWHPFTLTSAPENTRSLSLHVRSAGNWTSSLHERLPRLVASGGAVLAQVEGPYGTASRDVLEAPHAVAIAGGIGVTPFASILQSLLARHHDRNLPSYPLQKLHFVWLNRDQHSFEWFRELLAVLERVDRDHLLDIHTFMTGGRADTAGGTFDLARQLLARRGRGDLITGLRSATGLGAPDFDALLERFYGASPELPPPQVFFCGPKGLERVVERSCHRLGLRFRAERF